MATTDSPDEALLKEQYKSLVAGWLIDAANDADAQLQPARIGCGWGRSEIGVYRRELQDGRYVLGEVPDYPIDASVGVIRVDGLDGKPDRDDVSPLVPSGDDRRTIDGYVAGLSWPGQRCGRA